MDKADSIIMIGQQARTIQSITPDRKARRLAGKAVKHATAALYGHNVGDDLAGISSNLEAAKGFLKDAVSLHVRTLTPGETPDPAVLDHKYLGEGQKLHEQYLNSNQ